MAADARLSDGPIDAGALLSCFLQSATGTGAVVSFCGLTRGRSRHGGVVERMFLEHHPRRTLASLEAIAADGASRFGIDHVLVVHRHGTIAPGQAIVFVAAAAAHRRAAFLAADFLMDRLKTEAVFWKREEGHDGAHWIEPTDADRIDRARWED